MTTVRISREKSQYMQSSWMFTAEARLDIAELAASIQLFGRSEAEELLNALAKSNLWARHQRQSNFYLRRIQALAGHTVIIVPRAAEPDDMIPEAKQVADAVEATALLSVSLVRSREDIQRRLSITTHRRSTLDLTIGRGGYNMRSRFRPEENVRGLPLDEQACRRYHRCGFGRLASLGVQRSAMATRVATAVRWLVQSRQEPLVDAAIVKTAIALETLLVSNESDPLVRVLSERSAFILSHDPEIRERISRVVKRFYAARSGIVHGSRKKASELSPTLLEGVDRLAVLLCLVFGANTDRWPSHEELQRWGEGQRWGQPAMDVVMPFPSSYLSNALSLAERRAV